MSGDFKKHVLSTGKLADDRVDIFLCEGRNSGDVQTEQHYFLTFLL